MAGAFDWLDTLSSSIGEIGGKAVDAAGNVASAKIAAEAAKATRADTTPVPATSPLQTATTTFPVNPVWIGVGLVAVVGLVLLLRKAS